ncbi:MAG: M50 family metallopeptidase [Enterococcus sp.]|nr:M50 family metallopeptidase [Enterococcus sp.]
MLYAAVCLIAIYTLRSIIVNSRRNKYAVLIHEAGHAVITHLLGKEFCEIRVSNDRLTGEVEGCEVENPTAEDHKDIIRIYMAGTVACDVAFGNPYKDKGFDDMTSIETLLLSHPEIYAGVSKEQFLYTLRHETYQLVKTNFDMVKTLANSLKTKNVLSYAEASNIFS